MAGRTQRHGGSPPKLGRPKPGDMRHPTQGESDASGIGRKGFIFVDMHDELWILAAIGSGRYRYRVDTRRHVRDQLLAFWVKAS
jgi:hypothetical protein